MHSGFNGGHSRAASAAAARPPPCSVCLLGLRPGGSHRRRFRNLEPFAARTSQNDVRSAWTFARSVTVSKSSVSETTK